MNAEPVMTSMRRFSVGAVLPVVLVTGLVVMAAILYLPVRENLRLRGELKSAHEELAALEILRPLYSELTQVSVDAAWNVLPVPARARWKQHEVIEAPAYFADLAVSHGMELVAIHPRVVSAPGAPRSLHVELEVAGPYERIKDMLLDVVGMPTLEWIGKVDVRREAVHESMKLSLWLALD